jgi:hypothetical protein
MTSAELQLITSTALPYTFTCSGYTTAIAAAFKRVAVAILCICITTVFIIAVLLKILVTHAPAV